MRKLNVPPKLSLQATDFTELSQLGASDWRKAGEKTALQLFAAASKRVPAYQKFLASHNIDPTNILTIKDFARLPTVDKDNYLAQYSLNELSWDGQFSAANSVSLSSGSTGQPSFWPTNDRVESYELWYYELIHQLMFEGSSRSSLGVVCFGMGSWTAGTHMTRIFNDLKRGGYPVTVISPGVNKLEALRSIERLGPMFDQTIVCGYPAFVKDLIDEGEAGGLDWSKYKVKMVYGGESYNESWRDFVVEKVGNSNVLLDTANVYASADAGIMAVETSTAIQIKRYAHSDADLSQALYKSQRSPSLQQYNPAFNYFEAENNELILSLNNAIPLIRYNLHDNGGIFDYDEATQLIGTNYNLSADLTTTQAPLIKLPFVYVFGRAHNTATLYSVKVYPENIRAAAEDPRIRHYLSGKFKMSTTYQPNMDQSLSITFELAHNQVASQSLTEAVEAVLVEKLRALNSEYNALFVAVAAKAIPKLNFLPNGDVSFKPGAKLAKVTAKP